MGLTYNGTNINSIKYNGTDLTKVTYNGTIVWEKINYTGLCFTANEANSTIELISVGSPSIANTAYSIDGINWINFVPSATEGTNVVTLANIGSRVFFRNDITANFSDSDYLQFKMSGSIAASGNCNSLYSALNFETITTLTYTYCFYYLFKYCYSLKTAPELPATTLSNYCYANMFYCCYGLKTAPALPATILANFCYFGMFDNCGLRTAPELPATDLAINCYYYMFASCTSLKIAPELPATTLTEKCYADMFYSCTSLTTAPELPVMALATYCYYEMFRGCTSLVTPPALLGNTVKEHFCFNCYGGMFRGCKSLKSVPILPLTTLDSDCYQYMFYECTSLQVNDTQTSAAQYSWNIPDSGAFTNTTTYNQSGMFYKCAGTRSSDDMSGALGELHTYYTQNEPIGYKKYLCFRANVANSTIELCKVGSPSISNTAYSYDRITWTTFTPSTTAGTNVITLTNVGDKVYFINDITANFDTLNHLNFKMTGSIAASGNCNSIYNSTNFETITTLNYNYCFYELFKNCSSLTAAPKLPATTLSTGCYDYMFYLCTNLTTVPELPATTLTDYCYAYMFRNCSALTAGPELSATNLASYCYCWMFSDCSSLITPPSLPATVLANYCYTGMFINCTSLSAVPDLPATTLAEGCYNDMFKGCTGLTISDSSFVNEVKSWVIPSSGTFTNATIQTDMFSQCAGTRSSDNLISVVGGSCNYSVSDGKVTISVECYDDVVSGAGEYNIGDTVTLTTNYSWNHIHWDDEDGNELLHQDSDEEYLEGEYSFIASSDINIICTAYDNECECDDGCDDEDCDCDCSDMNCGECDDGCDDSDCDCDDCPDQDCECDEVEDCDCDYCPDEDCSCDDGCDDENGCYCDDGCDDEDSCVCDDGCDDMDCDMYCDCDEEE